MMGRRGAVVHRAGKGFEAYRGESVDGKLQRQQSAVKDPKRRFDDPRRRRMSVLVMESLENRRLLTVVPTPSVPTWHPTDTNLLDAQNGPMANLGPYAVTAYSDFLKYEAQGAKGTFSTSVSTSVMVVGFDVEVDVEGYDGNFAAFETAG